MAIQARKNRIDKVLKILKSAEPPLSEVKFVSLASYNVGVSPAKIQEYLTILKNLGVVDIEGGMITWEKNEKN